MYSEPCPDHCTEGYAAVKKQTKWRCTQSHALTIVQSAMQLWKSKLSEGVLRAMPWPLYGGLHNSMVNFLCWLLFQCLFHPRVTAVARKRSQSFCQKCRWQVTAKHAYTLHMWLCTKWHGAWLYGIHRTHWDISRFMWRQPFQCWSTALQWIFKNAL